MEKRREIKTSHPAQLPLELAVIRICEGLPARVPSSELRAPGVSVSKDAFPAPSKLEARSSKLSAPAAAVAQAVAALEAEINTAPPAADLLTLDSRLSTSVADTAAPVTTVDAIKERWKEFMEKAGEQNHGLLYLLGVGAPVEVVGRIVRIGFDFAFHRDKMNQDKNRHMLEKALAGVIGADDIRVEGVLLEKKDALVHDDAAPAEAAAVPAQAAPAFDGNILQAFGGRVVE
jgi:hypothetical protein